MLLHEEIRDEKVANNGGVFIIVSCLRISISYGLGFWSLLEDQKCDKIIPWEVDLKLNWYIYLVFLMAMEA